MHAFGVRGHPNNVRLIDSLQYIFQHREEALAVEFFIYLFITGVIYALVRKVRNLPWFILFTALSVLLGYLMRSHKNVLALNIAFKGYEELFSFFGSPFSHFFSFKVFWYKACTGEFIMHMLFFTAAVFVESVTSLRVARSHNDRTSDESAEILGLSLTNIVFGCLGLLPVSIPVARNVLAFETGANNKIYHLFSAGLLFSMAFLAWPLMRQFPNVTISAYNSCLGIMLLEVKSLVNLVSFNRPLIVPVTILILGSMFMDVLTAFSLSLISYFLIYFNIGGYEYFKIENCKEFFD